MRISSALVLRTSKTRSDGTAPVYIRLTQNRKSRFKSTGIFVDPKHWNERKSRVRASHRIATAINAKLDDLSIDISEACLTATSMEGVFARIGVSGSGTLTAYIDQFIERLQRSDRYWDEKKYRTTKEKLHAALGSPLNIEDLTPDSLTRFEAYCRNQCGNARNTVRKELVRLQHVIRSGIRGGTFQPEQNPFARFEIPKAEPVVRRRLSLEEIRLLETVELPNTQVRVVRDIYLFSFYSLGMRVSDAVRVRPGDIHNGRLEYRMMKTGQLQSVRLPAQAVAIVDRYVEEHDEVYPYLFPLLAVGDDQDPIDLRMRVRSATGRMNTLLKQVAKQAGIDPKGLSSHTARHSFADLARKHGNLYDVSKALGHTNLKTTQVYLSSFDQDAVDALSGRMFGD